MKYLLLIALLFLSGCQTKTVYVDRPVYIQQKLPALQPQPNNPEVKFHVISFNETEEICLSKSDATQLATNWIDYQGFCNTVVMQYKTFEINGSK